MVVKYWRLSGHAMCEPRARIPCVSLFPSASRVMQPLTQRALKPVLSIDADVLATGRATTFRSPCTPRDYAFLKWTCKCFRRTVVWSPHCGTPVHNLTNLRACLCQSEGPCVVHEKYVAVSLQGSTNVPFIALRLLACRRDKVHICNIHVGLVQRARHYFWKIFTQL